jgi:molybdate transport system permease protein
MLRPIGWLLRLACLPLLALLVVPLAALLLRTSPSVVSRCLGESTTAQAIGLSLGTGSATLLLTLAFGTPLAYVLARKRFLGKGVLEVLIDLPTVLPPAVAGIALLITLGRRGMIGGWLQKAGIEIAFTPAAVVIAQTFVAAPYYIKAAAISLAGVGEDMLAAAALDGAGPALAFWHITLPLSLRGIVGGAALCWSRALGEFGATIIFAGNYPGRTQTMPLAVYIGFESDDMNQALTLAAIMLAVSFALLFTIRATLRSRDPVE